MSANDEDADSMISDNNLIVCNLITELMETLEIVDDERKNEFIDKVEPILTGHINCIISNVADY